MEKTKDRDSLIVDNTRLVSSLCSRFSGKGVEFDDLYQAGCVGLVKAADAFDESRGFQFSTYAVPVILGEIKRLFRDDGPVKVSRSIKELYIKVLKCKNKLSCELNREPTVSEIAQALNIEPESVSEALCACQATLSLTRNDDESENEQIDLPVSDNSEKLNDKLMIDGAFKKLDEQECKIIRLRYYNYMTQNETAKKMEMSQVQVSRAEKKILKKLRGILTELSMEAETGLTDYVVCGIGVNCRQAPADFPEDVTPMATSLRQLLGRSDACALAAAMMTQLHLAAEDLLERPGDWMAGYKAHCVTIGQDVKIVCGDSVQLAHVDDMDDQGALLVTLADGTKDTVFSGEVSVRGMYGYL